MLVDFTIGRRLESSFDWARSGIYSSELYMFIIIIFATVEFELNLSTS